MRNGKKSKCCTCGYEWITGENGSHSCSQELNKRLKKIEKLAFDNVGAKAHEDADLALVRIHAIASEVNS